MVTEQGNLNQAEPAADIENVLASVGSASFQYRDSPDHYGPSLQAAFKFDWESLLRAFEHHDASKIDEIKSKSQTVLQVVALKAPEQALEKLVEHLSKAEALDMVDCHGHTALHDAVKCGSISMVKALVKWNPKLTQLADKEGRVPLRISAMHEEIAQFLAEKTNDDGPSHPFSNPSVIDTIRDLILNGRHDTTLYLVKKYPDLITKRRGEHANHLQMLDELAKNKRHFPSVTRLSVLEALIYKCIPVGLNYEPTNKNSDLGSLWNAAKIIVPIIKRIHDVKLRHMAAIQLAGKVCEAISHAKIENNDFSQMKNSLNEATKWGITEIAKLFIHFFPHFIWILPHGERLQTEAVKFRQERILSLFLVVSSNNKLSLVRKPSKAESMKMMTAVAECAKAENCRNFDAVSNKAGAAFQMQRELQWYKAVESLVHPHVASGSCFDEKTYWNKFVESHKELTEKGEKWVKDTANSCMLVLTLIATVLFAAAFTVPGGNDDKIGVPLLLGHDSFYIFAISDALGLFSSVTAILLFLAILTSRYAVQDFLHSLPKKIIMGLSLLFLSLAFMLVAFAATLAMVIDKRLEWAFIPITVLASVPVALFAVLELPLLFLMVKSTYGPSIFRPQGIWDGVKSTKQDQELTDIIVDCL